MIACHFTFYPALTLLFDIALLVAEASKAILVSCGWVGSLALFVWWRDKEMHRGRRLRLRF
jgi:hypothetical protein